MAVAREHAFRDRSGSRVRIWSVVHAGPVDRDTAAQPVRICSDLQVVEVRDRGLAEVAEAQRGLVHRSQLRALGFGRGAIDHRLKIGTLHWVQPSVFAVGHPTHEPLAREVAALLSIGDDCALSHATAAALWGISRRRDDYQIAVTVAGRNPRERRGVRIHRVRWLDGRDVRLREGIPLTAPARTLIDLVAESPDDVVERAIAEARVLRLVSDREIASALGRCPTRAGSARIRALLRSQGEAIRTRSEAERRLLALIERAGLPRPETNVRLLGYEVDLLWRAARLVIETDGWAFHGHRAAFERDRVRDQALVAAGYRVIRITWRQLEREPLAVLARIAQALQAAAA